MSKYTIGIIGGGFVGSATYLLNCKDIKCKIYDLDEKKCVPQGTKLEDLEDCDVIFICVPTPMKRDRSCHTGIVENVIKQVKKQFPTKTNIVVRSTVPVGFSKLHGVHFMPEFLTEGNWKEDFYLCINWIIGVNEELEGNQEFKKMMNDIFIVAQRNDVVYHTHSTFYTTSEAEMIKYFRNAFLATKVGFCNEIYRFCEASNLDYTKIIRASCGDTRIGGSHTMVPGPDKRYGFGGTCLPKDINSLQQQFIQKNIDCPIIASVVRRNEEIDRPELDWLQDEGRAFIQ